MAGQVISPQLLPQRESKSFPPQSDGAGRSGKPAEDAAAIYNKVVIELEKKINALKEKQVKQQEEITEFLNRAAGLSAKGPHSHDSIKIFLSKGYSLNVTSNYSKDGKDSVDGQNSAMHLAAQKGDLKTVKLLFEHGASANLINSKGRSVLDEAKFLDESKCPEKEELIKFLTPLATVKSPSATRVTAILNSRQAN